MKTKTELKQDAWINFSEGLKYFGGSSFQSVFENGFNAGFDCRDKLDNEDLKEAVEALFWVANFNMGVSNLKDDILDIKFKANETLAKIRDFAKCEKCGAELVAEWKVRG